MENRKGMWYTIEKYIAQEAHMEYQKLDEMYLLRAERGEELLTCIGELCEKEKITAGFVMGIGAVGTVEMGLFKTAEKRYISRELQRDFEIVSLTGNITRMDGKPYLHLHIAVADEEQNVRGGHLNRAVVSATGEIVIVPAGAPAGRRFSGEIGLNLLDFA